MAAASSDLLKKLSRKWVGQIGAAGVSDDVVTTIPLSSTTNLATDTAVVATIDRVDANGTKTPTLEETVIGVVSGSNLVTCTRGAEGTAQSHAAGAVVEILVTAKGYNDIIDHLLVGHTQLGAHTSSLVTTLKATGAEINTGTEDAKIVTPKAIEDSNLIRSTDKASATENAAGTDDAKFLTALANVPAFNNSLYRQALINGNFDVWQRGTSFTGTSPYYSADRWSAYRSGAAAGATFSRQTASLNGSLYSIRCQRDSGNSATNNIVLAQALETNDSIKLRGKKLTLSFWAKCGANYSSANSYLPIQILSGTGTDQSLSTGFTDQTAIASDNKVLTTSWQYFTLTTSAVVGNTINEIGVFFSMVPVGTASTNDWYEVAQVQLCAGDVALPFMPKSFEEEAEACDRFTQVYVAEQANGVIGAQGIAFASTGAQLVLPLRKKMRSVPALTATAADWKIGDTTASWDVTTMALGTNLNSSTSVILEVAVASGLTAKAPYFLIGDGTTNRTIILSAEL